MQHISKIAFEKPSSAEKRTTLTSPAAAEAVAVRLLDCFGRASVGDPDIWIDEVAAILMRYDEAIVAEAFQPGVGLQSRCRFLPDMPDIREACEAVAAERARVARREQLARHRVLIDTPLGLLPESEVDPSVLLLAGPPVELTPRLIRVFPRNAAHQGDRPTTRRKPASAPTVRPARPPTSRSRRRTRCMSRWPSPPTSSIAERLAEQWRRRAGQRSAASPTATQPGIHSWPLHQAGIHDHLARLPAAVLVLRRLEEMADAERPADLRRLERPRRQPAGVPARSRRGGVRHAAQAEPARRIHRRPRSLIACRTIRSTCWRA
jgi:hypothetical protein